MHGRSESKLLIERRSFDRPFASLTPKRAAAIPLESKPSFVAPQAQSLAFRVGIVDSEADLARVQVLREQAYGHHLPGLAAQFGKPDPVDRWPDVTIFYAEDKQTGRLVGSARLQSNLRTPLQLERNIELPDRLRGRHLAEITRLAVLAGYPHSVRLALVKALHLHCVASQIEGIVAASRPSLSRQYQNLGFGDMFDDGRLASIDYGGGLPHRILYRDAVTSEAYHRERNHPDYAFVFRTFHPDIQIFAASPRTLELVRPGPVGTPALDQAA